MAFFSFLDHLNFIEDDSSRYEVGITDEGFSYLDLVSEKKARRLTFADKQSRETGAALDGSTRARGQSNVKKVETIDHDEVCFDTDLMAILRDIERRRQRVSVFPWALGAGALITLTWLFFVLNLAHPVLAFVLSAIFVVPAIAFGLVNAWHFDRSRKDVHFAYKISGRGTTAFSRVNSALQKISESGQTLLLAGRRHFEDTRYSGGAASLPEFKKVTCRRDKPPLLDLEFVVWHMRAFNRDFYFMPDHVLVFDGSRMGGVNYGNLDVSTATDVTQARGLATLTSDAKVVGKTHRFVNNDGSPDQRFNNNIQIPLIEYGVLTLRGAGLDVSLFVTNQQSAFHVPNQLAEIKELASKPVRKISEQRRAEAAARRKARQDELFTIVLDALGCVMFADGEASKVERATAIKLMQRIRAPWTSEEVHDRLKDLRNRVVGDGLDTVVENVCARASSIEDDRKRKALKSCLDHVAKADGAVDAKETSVRDRIVAATE